MKPLYIDILFMSVLNYVHLLGCVGVFSSSKLLESRVNKPLSMMINFKYRMDVSSTKASQNFFNCNTRLTLGSWTPCFKEQIKTKFMCMCIFLLNEELNILIVTSQHGICAWSNGFDLFYIFKSVEIFLFWNK